ncbi:hypothetical protein ACQBAU_14555 [Propionibacteriaceae bacterium Y2011]|uniref:hypothetical protein n=1 Tax=Microlunatus sp. Y2014 TaxID=3418488 RepID=UPI003B4B15BE
MDWLSAFADVVRPLLAPDERALVAQHTTYFAGHEDYGQPRPDLASTLADHALGLPSAWSMELADKVVTGVSLVGWPGCLAEGLRDALNEVSTDLVVTTERLLAVTGIGENAARVLWQVPRSRVIKVDRAPRFAQAGRVIIVFDDRSALAMMMGLVSSRGARRVVAAFGTVTAD